MLVWGTNGRAENSSQHGSLRLTLAWSNVKSTGGESLAQAIRRSNHDMIMSGAMT